MRVEVWQAKQPNFFAEREEDLTWPCGYELVATCDYEGSEQDALSEAFAGTQWEPGVGETELKLIKTPARATSVGDVIVVTDQPWLVRGAGWLKLRSNSTTP